MSTTVTKRVSSAASGWKTARISEAPADGTTQRVPVNVALDELMLEGDMAPGNLLLEGDMAIGLTYNLLLEGDQQSNSTTITRRVVR